MRAGAVLVDQRRRLAKVSGSQGCKMTWGEDVCPRRCPGFKGDAAGVTSACEGLLRPWLTRHWGSWRFSNGQLNWFRKNGTIGFESVVLQVASRAHVYFSTWQRRLGMEKETRISLMSHLFFNSNWVLKQPADIEALYNFYTQNSEMLPFRNDLFS